MIVSGPPVAVDVPPTLVHCLAGAAAAFADRPLLLDGATTVTHREFSELVDGAALRLAEEGLRPGDRLAVALRNGIDVAVAIYACARGGFVFVGLPTPLQAPQWRYLLEHSGARLVLASDEFLDRAREAGTPAAVRPVGDHLTGRREPWRAGVALPVPEDVYAVVYTSGTTGRPKAAMLTHRLTMTVAGSYRDLLALTPDDRTAIHLPFYYVSGHVSQLTPFLLAGGSVVLQPRFTPAGLVQSVREDGVTVIDVVPAMFELLLREPGFTGAELPGLRAAYYGGAPMPARTVAALRERLPATALYEIYGMSETGGMITCLPDADVGRRTGTVGRPVPGVAVRVAGAAGEVGELAVRGPVVTPGYLGDEAATAAAITDGWLRTGDLARLHADGYVSLVGRAKDMISRGGVKVYPAELEALLASHPAVAEAAVFGVPDALAGEAVAVCVVAAAGQTVDATALRSYVRDRMAAHAVPRHVRVVEALPRNATGKVDKAALRRDVPPAVRAPPRPAHE
ncbi:MAG: class I adenylate-forming enzyme family protein [Pseudonocardiaceae bacterium]